MPKSPPLTPFGQVLESRRSGVAGPVGWHAVGELLWYASGVRGYADQGRAGIRTEWRPTPGSGGIHAISAVCISCDPVEAPRLYAANDHAFDMLDADASTIAVANADDLVGMVGSSRGCTIRLIGDTAKIKAAYQNHESLLVRDAGCMSATIGLCAEWLGLRACPLGFLGQAIVPALGFPAARFQGIGGLIISN